ncbi:MAG: UDP-N-acetylglucosamine 2-epimerase (non-hydrolyzing) [Candidatus Hydrogenedentes bacterium]|jgi:UDP-N-acetylglucosamine 2-epimerase (non-hydrolysing)|nr:UDP-N-acetylglucosamine 2-epimerase (non-hydrolyzing) [Candidatus Hydrogenedentota bacterium]
MRDPIKIAIIFGTRPEAIKLAPLYLRLCREPERYAPLLWVTGQHRQMLDQVLQSFALEPHRDFNLMRQGQSLTDVTCAVLESLQEAFAEERPDMVVVQGDTTTVFAGALAAFYARIPVGHVEAGLRTWNRFAPYPEEVNRQLSSCLADLHFAPTEKAKQNLLSIRIPEERVFVTGNTVIDALDLVAAKVRKEQPLLPEAFPLEAIRQGAPMILITGHRRENFGSGFESICQAILTLAKRYPDYRFVYPVHLNPNVRKPVQRYLSEEQNIHLMEPLSYEAFIWAMDQAYFLLSDSGGVQEEAPHLGKPVLVMRDTTERPEALEAGTSILVGTDAERIVQECVRLIEDKDAYDVMSQAVNPFGDGHACDYIADAIHRYFA